MFCPHFSDYRYSGFNENVWCIVLKEKKWNISQQEKKFKTIINGYVFLWKCTCIENVIIVFVYPKQSVRQCYSNIGVREVFPFRML